MERARAGGGGGRRGGGGGGGGGGGRRGGGGGGGTVRSNSRGARLSNTTRGTEGTPTTP